FDLNGVVSRDGFVGAIGAPGTLFFRSNDGGASWRASGTGITTPLRKLFFLDATHGWAAGDFGTIVATTDGGASWQIQRQGGTRAAILGVFGKLDDAPLEAFVRLACDEGYRSELAIVAREMENEGRSDEVAPIDRLLSAFLEVGGSGVAQSGLFRLDPTVRRDGIEHILSRFNDENDGRGRERFRELLVRLLREWRPTVVLTADSTLDEEPERSTLDLQGSLSVARGTQAQELVAALTESARKSDSGPRDAFQELLLSELAGAIRDAADPTSFPEHLTHCKLEPWRVVKARVVCRGGTQGDMTIDSDYYCPGVGRTIGEIAGAARSILSAGAGLRDTTSFQTLFTAGSVKNANKTFFDGVEAPWNSDGRRGPLASLAASAEQNATRAGARRKALTLAETLARQSAAAPRTADLFLGQLGETLSGTDSQFTLEYLSKSGRLFSAIGQWRATAQIYETIPASLYGEPQAREPLAWLTQYYAGSEPTRRVAESHGTAIDDDPGVRFTRVKDLAEALRDAAPDAFMSPEIRFPYAAVQMATGDYQGAMRFYLNRSQAAGGSAGSGGGEDDVWAVRAAAEYWLHAPEGDVGRHKTPYCPLCVALCRRTSQRPYLDGVIEPDVWDAAARLDLSTPLPDAPSREMTAEEVARAQWRAENKQYSQPLGTDVYFLADSEYLYVGAKCRKVQGFNYTTKEEPSETPRPRDARLTAQDRLELAIDVDGDYATACKFVVDYRGWLADSLWNDSSWNPQVFVARSEDESYWTIEAAIPLDAFCLNKPRPGTIWRLAARRVTPGVGVECWNVENSERGENAFGVLQFE
ncbi:MAG: hypothetical protein HUK22_06860, partial [Thermoguttaceae bacterium]|nr:hypothetical protein [Thermoguttaceae bacterium]